MDRQLEACLAAERIINMVESAGFDINDPWSIIRASHHDYPAEMRYDYGASRLTIWDEDYCDYVIKVGLYEDDEKYCQHEVEIYQAAVKEGVASNFAWCMCYSEPHREGNDFYPGIYVMEYIDCNEDEVYDSAWLYGYQSFCYDRNYDCSSEDAIEEYNRWNYDETEGMVLDYIEAHMTSDLRQIFNVFMTKWHITDIHTANVGFKGSKMVMVDYAGWNW